MLKEYFFHAVRVITGFYFKPFNTKWDDLLNQILDEGELLEVSDHTANFAFRGAVWRVWISNRWYSYAYLYELNGVSINSDTQARPRFKTMLRFHERTTTYPTIRKSRNEYYTQLSKGGVMRITGEMHMRTKPVIKSNEVLLGFYTAYAAWVDEGAEPGVFVRDRGLCANLFDYCGYQDEPPECHLEDMHRQFTLAGLDLVLPFNPGPLNYQWERNNLACHLNQRRIAWVRDRIEDGETEEVLSGGESR